MRHCLLLVAIGLSAMGCATLPRVDQDLFAAAKADNATEAARLLAAGAKINGKNDRYYEGLPPLAWAAGWGSIKTAELLLARGADVNEANKDGTTPLHVAAYHEQPAVAALLIRNGANVNARTEIGWTPLFKAMERLAFAPATEKPAEAEVAKVAGIMELLLASGAQVDFQGSVYGTPIHMAALTGQKTLVKKLIDKGADVNAKTPDGLTPLYQAARKGVADVAELLIARGADVNARMAHGNIPLSIAAEEGNAEVAKVLLQHGADVNARNKDGLTPLVWACKALLLRYALQSSTPGSEDIRRKVSLREVERDREELRRVKGEFGTVARLLIDRGADPNVAAGDSTPLQAAALVGDRALAEALLAHGASVVAAPGGETPLHAAIAESHGDVVELLVDKGANVNARNMSQLTPLHFLAVYMHDRKLAELLIQHGADVSAKDKGGHTPLVGAIHARNDEVAEVLRQHGAE